MTLTACILVLVGGFLGGCARFAFGGVIGRALGEGFPWGTMAINITGAVLIGLFTAFAASSPPTNELLRDFIVVGCLGGYTTISSFSLQTVHLMLEGRWPAAVFNAAGSGLACVAAVGAGFWLAGAL
ncbi:MAG TPA: fluoride efflux transporter CrcB [Devosiaceae bacterium]|jgi:CrcB protein